MSRGVARRLGLAYLDTGAMYRAVAWWTLGAGIAPDDSERISAGMAAVELDVGTDPYDVDVAIAGHDVTDAIRDAQVTARVSAVSALPAVRQNMVSRQRALVAECVGRGQGVVVEGRDIGSTVLPDADVKIFLTASVAARAERRRREDALAGREPGGVDATASALRARDEADAGRTTSPLARARDAVVVDATELTLPEVIDEVVGIVNARLSGADCPVPTDSA